MNNNDTTTTPRYSVWLHQHQAEDMNPNRDTWEQAQAEYTALIATNERKEWRIWDHSTTPPTDVTDAAPQEWEYSAFTEPAAPLIPDGVKELTIKRGEYRKDKLYMTVYGEGWQMYTETTTTEVLTRIQEIADAMEKIK